MTTCAQSLVRLLEGYGVDTVFGIPGVHTVELYRGLHGSRLRHLPDQRAMVAGVCAFSHTLQSPEQLPELLARAFAVFKCARPRPVHLEIPLDVLEMPAIDLNLMPRSLPGAP
eukprot:gene8129-7955_t